MGVSLQVQKDWGMRFDNEDDSKQAMALDDPFRKKGRNPTRLGRWSLNRAGSSDITWTDELYREAETEQMGRTN